MKYRIRDLNQRDIAEMLHIHQTTYMLSDNEYNGILLDIGIKIGYYRRKAGMTQDELAEVCNLSSGYIAQLESPNLPYCPSIKSLFTIAKALGVKASKLIDIEED